MSSGMKSKIYNILYKIRIFEGDKVRIARKYILCLVIFLCFSTVGCGREGQETYEVILTGDSLSECEWQYEENPEGIVENIRNEFIDSENGGDETKYSFVFSGKNKGETELIFSYINELNEKTEKNVKIKLKVFENRKIIEKYIKKSDDTIEIIIK